MSPASSLPTASPSAPKPWSATLQKKRLVSPDGTGIAYEVLGRGEKTIVFCNGLGGRLYALEPLVDALWERYRIVTWDYRGLFESDSPRSMRSLALHHHVDDLRTLLETEKIDEVILLGWSMGVQIALDFAATYPKRVRGLILMNGTYGNAFATGFQPIFSVPGLPKRLHAFVEWMQKRPEAVRWLAALTRLTEGPTTALMYLTAGDRAPSLRPTLRRYYHDVLGASFHNYMRLFQELDAHSIYHLLPEIEAPALIISGKLDFLTPSRQSEEMARRMPHAEHLALTRASHFAVLERPREVIAAIERFLARLDSARSPAAKAPLHAGAE